MRPSAPTFLTIAAVLLASCGSADSITAPLPTAAPSATGTPTSIRLCSEVPEIRTAGVEGDFLSSGERFELMLTLVAGYTDEHPDTFAGQWIDREAGTFVVAFTDDSENHREDLLSTTFGPDGDQPLGEWGVAIDVVQTPISEADLIERSQTIFEDLRAGGFDFDAAAAAVTKGIVALSITEASEQTLVDLEAVVDPAEVCVEGPLVDPDRDRPEPGDELNIIVTDDPTDLASLDPALLVQCDGFAFPISRLITPTTVAESGEAGLAEALETFMAGDDADFVAGTGSSGSAEDWLFLGLNDDLARVLFDAGDFVTTMGFVRQDDGWTWGGSSPDGGCDLQTVLPDELGDVSWELDPSQPAPGPESTSFTVLATERACSGARSMGDQLLGPQVVETDRRVLVALAVIPPTGAQTCPGNPSTPVTIELDAPLGDRTILDGRTITLDIGSVLAD